MIGDREFVLGEQKLAQSLWTEQSKECKTREQFIPIINRLDRFAETWQYSIPVMINALSKHGLYYNEIGRKLCFSLRKDSKNIDGLNDEFFMGIINEGIKRCWFSYPILEQVASNIKEKQVQIDPVLKETTVPLLTPSQTMKREFPNHTIEFPTESRTFFLWANNPHEIVSFAFLYPFLSIYCDCPENQRETLTKLIDRYSVENIRFDSPCDKYDYIFTASYLEKNGINRFVSLVSLLEEGGIIQTSWNTLHSRSLCRNEMYRTGVKPEQLNQDAIDYNKLVIFLSENRLNSIITDTHFVNLSSNLCYTGSDISLFAALDMVRYKSSQDNVTVWFQKGKKPTKKGFSSELFFNEMMKEVKTLDSTEKKLISLARLMFFAQPDEEQVSEIKSYVESLECEKNVKSWSDKSFFYCLQSLWDTNSSLRLSVCQHQKGDNVLALAYALDSITKKSVSDVFVSFYAGLLRDLGFLGQSVTLLEEVLRQVPDNEEILHSAAKYVSDLGGQQRAESYIDRCKELRSSDMMVLSFAGTTDIQKLKTYHERWYNQEKPKYPTRPSPNRDWDRNRKIRVGFVSPDFKLHPVSFFMKSFIKHINSDNIDLHYYFTSEKGDEVTEQFKKLNNFSDVSKLSYEELADRIESDKIDILIDLVGHAGSHKLQTFMLKPAPIQCTWLGYMSTTGVREIDYWINDRVAGVSDSRCEPICESKMLFLDRPWSCYSPSDDAPPVAIPEGPITFGSFQNYGKVTPNTIALWARVLREIPESRFLLKTKSMQDEQEISRITAMFKQHGVDSNRLILLTQTGSIPEHLSLYGMVDISLDPVEMSGATTTCEALYQGVPVVTLAGNHFSSRMSTSILSSCGLHDWIADSQDRYVEIAKFFSQDINLIRKTREYLRELFRTSKMMDSQDFAREFEKTMRVIWTRKCIEKTSKVF